jgi:hypothetical protein
MRRLRGALIVLVACGAPPPAKPPNAAPPLEVKTFSPLGMKSDAKATNQAIILGTDKNNGSTVLPLPVAQPRTYVDALFVKATADVDGGITSVKLATAPSADGAGQVGVFEAFAGGPSAQWRTSVWASAMVAATALNKDLADFTFSATSTGYIDGVSASGLIAAGFLAAMTGAPVAGDVTMTGIINPDGSIGPVGGIPEKLAAAMAKGKKRIGYPSGMRMARSTKTNELVDLHALAKAHGAQAIEVADVHQAYKLLTGKVLPAPVAVDARQMALDDVTQKALDAKYKQWQERLATEWGAILQLESAGRLPQILTYLRDSAKSDAAAAETLHKQGLYAAAYQRMIAAWSHASAANQIYDVLSKATSGKVDDAIAALTKLDDLDEQTAAVFAKIGALEPSTMGGQLQMMAAFRAALRGWSFHVFAAGALASTKAYLASLAGTPVAQLGSEKSIDKIASMVAPTILYMKRNVAETTMASEQLELGATTDIAYSPSLPNVHRVSTSFSTASAANLDYFDTLLVEPMAQSAKLSDDDARYRVEISEPGYVVALMLSHLDSSDGLPKELREQWGENSLAWNLLSLAGSELAYSHSSELIARYDSLEIKQSSTGEVTGVEHEKAFANLLATAERKARENARAARVATGSVPVQARLAYQLASVESKGTVAEKLDALTQFWSSSAFSQTAVMLARN